MIPRLKLVNVTKRYGSTVANDAISLEVMPGEILSVLGENGAGKSTLMKIIFGSVTPDEGEIYFDGRKVNISSPADARELGIAMVFQHFVLFETLTAKENILNVFKYLTYLFKELPNTPFNEESELLENYLPWSQDAHANCR